MTRMETWTLAHPTTPAGAAAMALAACMIFLVSAAAQLVCAASVEHTFVVSQMNKTHLCKETLITVVNGKFPGPAIEVTEGDSVAVNVINKSPYNITIHWHGVKQWLNCWADGVPMVTQFPILPNHNFVYRFETAGQQGTLWWHSHVPCLRATLHGALIIQPKHGSASYPFPKPDNEIPVLIGEWWQENLIKADLELKYHLPGQDPYFSASTINGLLGYLYNCSGTEEEGYVLNVEQGKTYLLRIINAALFSEYYLKIAGHKFIVVAADANYVKPYKTDVIAIAPGETVDALVVADAHPGMYYMVALPIQAPEPDLQDPVHITRGTVVYTKNESAAHGEAALSSFHGDVAVAPEMPDQHDWLTTFYFHGNMTSLRYRPQLPQMPMRADEHLFITLGLGSICHQGHQTCKRTDSDSITLATMNNMTFELPLMATPLLDMHYYSTVTLDKLLQVLPDRPPSVFNYTDEGLISRGPKEQRLEPTSKALIARRFQHGTIVELVFQNTAIMGSDTNPMHLHGHDMFVLAQGFGNYNATRDVASYNLVDPPVKNTVHVPRLGWAAIRFVADNPGIWYMHCHFEFHLSMGMAALFIVENGSTASTSLPPPPSEFSTFDQSI